jgi:Tfp pilus assembly protein PilX
MHSFITRLKNEKGNVMILAFILLVVLTLIGIFASRTAQIDLQVAYNEVPYRQNFYIAEGGVNREAAELGTANPANIKPIGDETRTTRTLSSTYSYQYRVHQLGTYVAPKGYSAILFSRYDYSVETWAGGGTSASGEVNVASRLYKVGPKAE